LVEAKHKLELRLVMARWSRYDLIVIDEVGYVPLAEVGAEFLFQVVAERAERAAVVLTTNLPFSEWTQALGGHSKPATGGHLKTGQRGMFGDN
jgi:DNA replication protein DnaC